MNKVQTVICMRWGNWPVEDVNILFRSVCRNTERPTRFIVLTDDASSLDDGIETRPLPTIPFWNQTGMYGGPGWNKLALWAKEIGITGEVLYLDLDVVITGNIDAFFDFHPGEFCIIRNWTEKFSKIGNSSIMKFVAGSAPYIVDKFAEDPIRYSHDFVNEQIFVTKNHKGPIYFWPKEWCPSFKKNLLPPFPIRLWKEAPLPAEAKMVVFTGEPRPRNAALGKWPAKPGRSQFTRRLTPVTWLKKSGW